MRHSFKGIMLNSLGLTVCIVPVAIATLSYFPIWQTRGTGELVSGFYVFLLILCIYPLIKAIKHFIKSPSVFSVWLLLFILFLLLENIAHEMTVISFVGALSNLIGGIIFRIARKEV